MTYSQRVKMYCHHHQRNKNNAEISETSNGDKEDDKSDTLDDKDDNIDIPDDYIFPSFFIFIIFGPFDPNNDRLSFLLTSDKDVSKKESPPK